MKIRLHGTPDECTDALVRLADVIRVVDVSRMYQDRPPSQLVRVYVEARLDLPAATDPRRAGQPPALEAGHAG